MPLDVLGRTRATLTRTASGPWPRGLGNLGKPCRAGDRPLQLLVLNEEFLVSASHQLALITSLPFVHTARRYYRLDGLVRPLDWRGDREVAEREAGQTWSSRGSTSRNKVSVGEPAEGSLTERYCALWLGTLVSWMCDVSCIVMPATWTYIRLIVLYYCVSYCKSIQT